MTDISLCRALNSRKMVLQLTPPLSRFETITPYTNPAYTQWRLDMRRKAEILQYRKNASSTRASSYTSVMRGQKIITCNEDRTKLTPTSSCDVPGAVAFLQYEPTVPLYNFALNVDNYGMATPDIQNKFGYAAETDIQMTSGKETTMASVASIDLETYKFRLNAPIGVYVSGTAPSTDISGTITISNITVRVYYGGSLVSSSVASGLPPAITYTVSANATFNVYQFAGNITTDFELPAQNDFAYDVKMTMTIANTRPEYSFGGVCNISRNTVIGCSISPIATGRIPFGITTAFS
jgi:hypothetical protein